MQVLVTIGLTMIKAGPGGHNFMGILTEAKQVRFNIFTIVTIILNLQWNDDSKLLGSLLACSEEWEENNMRKQVMRWIKFMIKFDKIPVDKLASSRHIRRYPVGHATPSPFRVVGNTLYYSLTLLSPEIQVPF